MQRLSPAYLQRFFRIDAEALSSPFFSHLPRWDMTSGLKVFLTDDVLSELDALAEALAALTEDGQRCAAAILRQQSSVSSALDEFGDAVSEEHEAATEASLAQSTNTVSEALTSSLDGAMDGLGAAIDSEVDGFVGEAMGLGTDLDHTWNSAL